MNEIQTPGSWFRWEFRFPKLGRLSLVNQNGHKWIRLVPWGHSLDDISEEKNNPP